ncbi:uncharacterized protein TRIREDRAFT_120917 [Trichoderma reesei QM6a]|uniref:Predicted protein n=2 Tax=Hypocrea jecorina TaxID=51453 RepID=G0RE65_HYPJQ|nr:uncharacterized protein TRIREDRAFT_120917 [Trichoderma reesei QM6a]EGR50120.1 predicted protein [Trichoderma reesei QM6a]
MSRSGDEGLDLSSDDDLIEVHFEGEVHFQGSQASAPSSRGRSIFHDLLHPQGVPPRDSTMAGSVSLRPSASHSRRAQPAQSSTTSQPRLRHSSHSQQQQQQQASSQQASMLRAWTGASPEGHPPATTYIDLTEEPDSPVERRRTQASDPQVTLQQVTNNIAGRHPRRTNSQRISPPQLARSDSTLVGGQSSYIDLTVDEDEQQRSGREHWRARAHQRPHHHHHHHHHHHTRHNNEDHLVALRLMGGSGHHQLESGIRVLGRTLADILNGNFTASLNSPQNRFPAEPEPRPKPPMEPIPSASAGFTRDTRAADGQSEELVTICPACNEELAYDPTESSTPSKKRKRAVGEHHFWALKSCGHVYCAECFENRKPTKTAPEGVGFRYPPGKSNATPNDILCAVDGCGTKVASKTEWVGIFL